MHESWWSILTDPSHLIAETIINVISELIMFTAGYFLGRKKIWDQIHKQFDKEHDITH